MRPALTIKNINRQNNGVTEAKNAGGKLVRQTGRSNLLKERQRSPIMKLDYEPKEDFVVYEDKWEEEDEEEKGENSNNDNNMLHELDKKMEQKSQIEENRKKYMVTREKSVDMMSVWDENSSAAPSVCGTVSFDDDEFDRQSAASTISIRAGLTKINVNQQEKHIETIKTVEPFADNDKNTNYVKILAKKEQREEEFSNCEEYSHDIYKYMLNRQTKVRSSSKYILKQAEVTIDMRSILIDWFNDVATEYSLKQETLHLAVTLVDRVLSKFCVEKHRLQLVGTTALMIASKYEEIYPPEVTDFAHITDDTFRTDQILMMERYLLSQLDFVISTPTTSWFGALFAQHQGAKTQTKQLMKYLIDLTLLDYTFLRFRPSHVAAACLCTANVMTNEEEWSEKMEKVTEIRMSAFAVLLPLLRKIFRDASSSDYPSIYKKYSNSMNGKVSLLPTPTSKYIVDPKVMRVRCPDFVADFEREY